MPPTCAMASMMSTPGMIGWPGKVALKERLVDRHVLDADDPLGPFDLDDPVHQQERIPVRDHVQDPADVHHNASVALSGAGEPAGQRDIALMARLGGHDVGLDPAADQCQVAQDVARLVAHELIGPAERAADQAVVGQYQGGLERGTQGEAAGPERIRLAQETEGARLRQLAGETHPA